MNNLPKYSDAQREQRRERQAALKTVYRVQPAEAFKVYRVTAEIDVPAQIVRMETGHGPTVEAGLHPLAGGEPGTTCAAEMLLEALAGCVGITFSAVAGAMRLPLQNVSLTVEGDVDFRGTLGIDRTVPVGLLAIRMVFSLPSASMLDDAQQTRLKETTDRYCVVRQSLNPAIPVELRLSFENAE